MSFFDTVNKYLDLLDRAGFPYAQWANMALEFFSKSPKFAQEYTPEKVKPLVDERIAQIEAASEERDRLKGEPPVEPDEDE